MADQEPSLPMLIPGTYRHAKTGRSYEVSGVAFHTEEEVPMVLYRPLYDSAVEYFVRPYENFIEAVEINGQNVPRFERLTR